MYKIPPESGYLRVPDRGAQSNAFEIGGEKSDVKPE